MQTRGFLQDNIFFQEKRSFFQDGKGGGGFKKNIFWKNTLYTPLSQLNGMEFDLFRGFVRPIVKK